MSLHIAIISARRPDNVEPMSRHAPNAVWYVAYGEGQDYRAAGASDVVEAGDLISARNMALEDAFSDGIPCVQVSDDLQGISFATEEKPVKIALSDAIEHLSNGCNITGAKLAGCAPTSNAFYFDQNRPIKTNAFIVGDLIYVLPSSPRFDQSLRLKEDYDFTAQHISAYGAVARMDFLLPKFIHRTNDGGAVSYRTSDVEQEAIGYLRQKWGDAIRENPRRKDEILFDGKRVQSKII